MSRCKKICCNHAYYLHSDSQLRCHYCRAILICDESSVILSKPVERPDGSALWRELHCYQWTTFADFREWFDGWLKRVDRLPYCSCGAKFRSKILPKFAGRFCIDSADEWFALSVEIHNAVNASLGKKLFSVDDAKAIWSGS